jgi:hypothetical protein
MAFHQDGTELGVYGFVDGKPWHYASPDAVHALMNTVFRIVSGIEHI